MLRFAGAVMLTTGLLLITDCVLSLVWEEPVTSYLAGRDQAHLRSELSGEQQLARRLAGPDNTANATQRLRTLAVAARMRARSGHAFGRIEIPSLDRSYVVVQGIDTSDLDKGPGHYPTTPFPGEGARTVAIAGHRTTYLAPFRTTGKLTRGALVVLTMPYGKFTYVVTGHKVVVPSETSVLNDVGYAQLVLTTCDPPFSASHRLVVFARLRTASPTV